MTRLHAARRAERRLALLLIAPALAVITLVAIGPIVTTAWEALHVHDMRLPALGRPWAGAANFVEAARDPRFAGALVHTLGFAAVSVPLELALGLALALVMHQATRGRALVRVLALLPWAIPTVVAALAWRFLFEARFPEWLVHPLLAWVPIVAADVWKTTPFVAVLLLAGLQSIDESLHDAARVDGAGALRRFVTITLPLLAPAMVVAGAFRALDAQRLFDLPYVLTAGGPGTATEPLSLFAYTVLMQRLRFGYGSALAMVVFLLALAVAVVCVRALTRSLQEDA